VEDATGSCSETCVTFDADGTEEGSIKFEAIYIKEEIPEATYPPNEAEHEVRLHGVCVVLAAHAL
jgi:hypothetical protein